MGDRATQLPRFQPCRAYSEAGVKRRPKPGARMSTGLERQQQQMGRFAADPHPAPRKRLHRARNDSLRHKNV